MSKMTPKEFWLAAASWGSAMRGGDPGACMYGFDEKGLVQSEEHRAACISWIDIECRKAADANVAAGEDPAEQHPQLDAMLAYLRIAPVAGSQTELDAFTAAYVEAALWSTSDQSTESGGSYIDENYSAEHIAPETVERMKADCAKFQALYGHLLNDDNRRRGTEASAEVYGGHDFWLTRCGHGSGFWDGDWQEPAATVLTEASKSFGNFDLEIGDDGRIYGMGGNSDPEPVEGAVVAPSMRS